MKTDHIELWNKKLLEIETSDGITYQTIILKVSNNDLLLQHPSNNNELLIPVGSQGVSVYFFDDNNNKYVFHTNLTFTDNRFVLPKPSASQVEKVQRRNFFRVPATLDMWIKMGSNEDEIELVKFVTDDISGGGVSFHCFNMEPFKVDDIVDGEIELDSTIKNSRIPFSAQVVNVSSIDSKRTRYAIEFISIKEMYRKDIMYYCMKRQTEMYKKLGDLL